MIELYSHNVFVEILEYDERDGYATISTSLYPDGGSTAHGLGPDELREVADMLNEAADTMKENDERE